jgi:hypothetical protein
VTTRGRNVRVRHGFGRDFGSLPALLLGLGLLGFDAGVLTTFGLAASRLPAADLTQAFGVLAIALVPAPRQVLASASFAQADPRTRSPGSGQTAVALRTVKDAHGSGNSQGKSSGRMRERSLRALSSSKPTLACQSIVFSGTRQERDDGLVVALGTRHAVKGCPSNDHRLENQTEKETV